MNKRNCVSGIFWIAFFSYFLYRCSVLDTAAAYWPQLICVLGLFLSAVTAVSSGLAWKKEGGSVSALPFTGVQMKRIAVVFLALVCWIACISILGFLVSTVISMTAIFIIFEPKRIKRNIVRDVLAAVISAVGMYALFTALGISFPQGILL